MAKLFYKNKDGLTELTGNGGDTSKVVGQKYYGTDGEIKGEVFNTYGENGSVASGVNSHAEGSSFAFGDYSHAEGFSDILNGYREVEKCKVNKLSNEVKKLLNLSEEDDFSYIIFSNSINEMKSIQMGIFSSPIAIKKFETTSFKYIEQGDYFNIAETSVPLGEATYKFVYDLDGTEEECDVDIREIDENGRLSLKYIGVNEFFKYIDVNDSLPDGEPGKLYNIETNELVATITTSTYISGTETKATVFNTETEINEGFCFIIKKDNVTILNGGASGESSHAEGYKTIASGYSSHAEGRETVASGRGSHAEGKNTIASGHCSHAEGGYDGNANIRYVTASGYSSHAEGDGTSAKGSCSHAEGFTTEASKQASHAEGGGTKANGEYSHAEGDNCIASGECSHAEGRYTRATGAGSHAEGLSGQYDQNKVTASGEASHAEGSNTSADARCSHAEGYATHARGTTSHSEGRTTIARGDASHAEGIDTIARADYSHAEGRGTIAASAIQHVQGKYNIEDTNNKYAMIIGNGESVNKRSNCFTVDWNGFVECAGFILTSPNGTQYKVTISDDGIFTTTKVE